jgi:RimJ/RimL family protein N-acetyltransferase
MGDMSLDRHPCAVPVGYPSELERRLRLRDGREVFIRPIVPADATDLAAAIRNADADTLRRRFLSGPPRLTPELLAHLTTVDYVRRFAVVAADVRSGCGVAIARYEPLEVGVAEIAVAVDPAWRRVGLATALVDLLAEAALDRGIHTFHATYQAQNRPVAALRAHARDAGTRVIRDGVGEFGVELDPAEVAAAVCGLDENAPDAGDSGRSGTHVAESGAVPPQHC